MVGQRLPYGRPATLVGTSANSESREVSEFRGLPLELQKAALRYAKRWLKSRPAAIVAFNGLPFGPRTKEAYRAGLMTKSKN